MILDGKERTMIDNFDKKINEAGSKRSGQNSEAASKL